MARPLWTIGEIVQATGAKTYATLDTPVTGVSIDSRSIAPHECFIAIRGANHDGHRFVDTTASSGAPAPSSITTSRPKAATPN